MTDTHPRYALYFTPTASSQLWRFGCGVIGYDADSGGAVASAWPLHPGLLADTLVERWPDLTSEPRRYGFHATLKAPFHLIDGAHRDDLLTHAAALARRLRPVVLEGLRVTGMKRFVALVPIGDQTQIGALAQTCVEALEPLRATLSAADVERRLAAGLTDRQQRQLQQFGYPYVGDDFRFHMTLSGPLPADLLAPATTALDALYRAMCGSEPVCVDQIAVLEQPRRDGAFRIVRRFTLGG